MLRLITDDLEEIRETIIKANNSFIDPQPHSDLRSLLVQIENNDLDYRFENKTIIQTLNIADEEQKELKAIINKAEVKRRNSQTNNQKNKQKRRDEQGLTQQERDKMLKLAAVERMLRRNVEVLEIAKRLKLSVKQVHRLIKELEKI